MREGRQRQAKYVREERDGKYLVQGEFIEAERIRSARRKIEDHIRKNPEATVIAARLFGIDI